MVALTGLSLSCDWNVQLTCFFFLFVHVRILTGALAIAIRQFHLFLEFRQFGFLVRLYEKFLQFVRPLP